MNVILVQGTWADNDQWWKADGTGTFADALIADGHTLLTAGPRQFEWSTDLPAFWFGDRELRTWRAPGRDLYDILGPSLFHTAPIPNLAVIAHSNGRHVVKYACAMGLRVDLAVMISGPVRKDVDRETAAARANIGKLVCLNGGKRDYLHWLGALFDGQVGIQRTDPEADACLFYSDSTHGSLLRDPQQYARVLHYLRSPPDSPT